MLVISPSGMHDPMMLFGRRWRLTEKLKRRLRHPTASADRGVSRRSGMPPLIVAWCLGAPRTLQALPPTPPCTALLQRQETCPSQPQRCSKCTAHRACQPSGLWSHLRKHPPSMGQWQLSMRTVQKGRVRRKNSFKTTSLIRRSHGSRRR